MKKLANLVMDYLYYAPNWITYLILAVGITGFWYGVIKLFSA